jgi:hypothetical protein
VFQEALTKFFLGRHDDKTLGLIRSASSYLRVYSTKHHNRTLKLGLQSSVAALAMSAESRTRTPSSLHLTERSPQRNLTQTDSLASGATTIGFS